jgi:hypothetical protein
MSSSTSAFSSCCFVENYSRNTLVESPGSAVQIATYAKLKLSHETLLSNNIKKMWKTENSSIGREK